MRKVSIDENMFIEAFQRDEDFEQYPQQAYLDLETGEVIWVFDEDYDADMWAGIDPEENTALRDQVEASPERYLEFRGRDHGEHHSILREFLYSNWTDDKKLWIQVQEAYSGSIGGWKEKLDDQNIVHAYYEFRDRKIKELAEEFFHEHNIQPIWR